MIKLLLLALTPGDVNAFYRGGAPELKQALLWVAALGAIGACLGLITYALLELASGKHHKRRRRLSDSARALGWAFRELWSDPDKQRREPYRCVWTEREIGDYFNRENVRWHHFERVSDGYLVRAGGPQGKFVKPPKPIGNFELALYLVGLAAVVAIIAIPLCLLTFTSCSVSLFRFWWRKIFWEDYTSVEGGMPDTGKYEKS